MSTDELREALAGSGHDQGEAFRSEAEVRAYFTRKNYRNMFGREDGAVSQDRLDELAAEVIRTRAHCAF